MRSVFGVLLILTMAIAGCARAKPSAPAMWKVSDTDNSLYLLGSFHFLKADDYPMSAIITNALADSEMLLFELSPKEMRSAELQATMIKAAMRTDGKRLDDDLTPELQAKLRSWALSNKSELAKLGIETEWLQRFEPWYVGLLVTIIDMQKYGLNAGLGLDNHFIAEAEKAGKPASGLERGSEQIALFDGMSTAEQLQLLSESLADSAKGQAELERLHSAWRKGNVDAIWRDMAVPMRRQYPALYQRINTARNDAWLMQLQQRLQMPGSDDTLVVVGALHLLGDDGLVSKLRAKGYRVERLQ